MADLAEITKTIAQKVGENSGIGKIIKLDFGEQGLILINAATVPNVVSNTDGEADATIQIAFEDFISMAKGALDPMMAFMTGKMKIQGDMLLAQKLAPLLKA
jgi:putative sterol carrier protein